MKNKKKFIILVGLPCMGKSTWVEEYLKEFPDTVVNSHDSLLVEYAEKKGLTYNEAYHTISDKDSKKLKTRFTSVLQKCYKEPFDIIIDTMNHRVKRRMGYFNSLSRKNFEIIAYVFPKDFDLYKERNDIRKTTGKNISEKLWLNLNEEYQDLSIEEISLYDEVNYV